MATELETKLLMALKGLLADLKKDVSSPEAIEAINGALDKAFPLVNAGVNSLLPGLVVPFALMGEKWLEGRAEALLDSALEGLAPPPPAPVHLQGAELAYFESLPTPALKAAYVKAHQSLQ